MSDIQPEDRERLAKVKFKEFLHEMFEDEFNSHFDKRVTERRSQPTQQQSAGQPQQQQQQAPARKRSLFEECISNTLGIG